MSTSDADSSVELVQCLDPDVFDTNIAGRLEGCEERVQRLGDLLGPANEKRVPGLGEEATVGAIELKDRRVGRLLQEHSHAMRLLPQPCKERARRLEGLSADFGAPEVDQALERFVESE